jgi:hypothetical protein
MGTVHRFSPNGSFLSRTLDSAHSVRFSKFECFETLMNSDEMGFCSSSRTGKSIRFRNHHIEVRLLSPQPGIPEAGGVTLQRAEKPAVGALLQLGAGL